MPPYSSRIQTLQNRLSSLEVDALLVQNLTDLYYLTGLDLSLGTLLITEKTASLLVDGRYLTLCQEQAPCAVLQLHGLDPLQELLEQGALSPSLSLGFDGTHTPFSTVEQWRHTHPTLSLISLVNPLSPQRMIKDSFEIQQLKNAAELGERCYQHVLHTLKEGVTEGEVARSLELFCLEQGGEGMAFSPIIAFGKQSALPHYRAGKERLQRNDIVLIDMGVTLNRYHSDMTRTHCFGQVHNELQEIYTVVHEAQRRAVELCCAGVTVADLDRVAREWIEKRGYGPQFKHGLGHGIGLEVHEPPFLKGKGVHASQPLQAGMVVTIEPGIYLDGLGGVRLEDTLLVGESSSECLTPAFLSPSLSPPIKNS